MWQAKHNKKEGEKREEKGRRTERAIGETRGITTV
jgi:hypothetical protein